MGLIGEARLRGDIGRRGALCQEFTSALDAKRHKMLKWSDGIATAICANEGILRDALGAGQLLYGRRLCQVAEKMRVRAKSGIIVRSRRMRLVLFGFQEACQIQGPLCNLLVSIAVQRLHQSFERSPDIHCVAVWVSKGNVIKLVRRNGDAVVNEELLTVMTAPVNVSRVEDHKIAGADTQNASVELQNARTLTHKTNYIMTVGVRGEWLDDAAVRSSLPAKHGNGNNGADRAI